MKRLANITEQLVRDLCADKSRSRTETSPVNCLIVEDDANDAYMALEAIGSVGGVIALVAKSGDEAISLLTESEQGFRPSFDIVFVDLRLQGSDKQGADVIKRIRELFPKTHTVIVSGNVNQEVLEMLRGSYVGIVSKPLDASNMEEILSKHRLRKTA